MIARLAWRELRQQVGGRVFPIVFAVSVLMVAGAMGIDQLRVGPIGASARTGAAAILRTHLVWTLFFLFTAAAFVGEAVLRDGLTGFADLVRATPVDRRGYALARFAGALAALLLCFASVPLAMLVSGAMLGLGTGSAGAYAFAWFALSLPDLLLAAALFFALAGVTRSMTGCLLGAAALLTLYGLGRNGSGAGLAVVEPFGFAALAEATRGWSIAQRDAMWPALSGVLLVNRLLWLAVTAALVGIGTWRAGLSAPRTGVRRARRASADRGADPPADVETLPPSPLVRAGPRVVMAQLLVRTRFEVRRVIATPAFAALLLMGLASAASAASRMAGTPATVAALATSFQLVPVVVALFFAGELFWAEREHGIASLVAATPVGGAVLVLPKLLALALVFLALSAASAAAGAAVQLAMGHPPAPFPYLAWYVLPEAYDWLLLGVLALFLQSLAPNKLAGWGYMVFYLIGSLALGRLGWTDPHYRYGGYPGAPLPPALSGAHGVGGFRLGWGVVALAMTAVACRRGPPDGRGRRSGTAAGTRFTAH